MPGGAEASVPSACLPPSSRMLPLGSTAREVTWAIAASALVCFELRASQPVREATGSTPAPSPKGVQLLSISPGWMMVSSTLAWSLLASTWLLLSRYRSEEHKSELQSLRHLVC